MKNLIAMKTPYWNESYYIMEEWTGKGWNDSKKFFKELWIESKLNIYWVRFWFCSKDFLEKLNCKFL